MKLSEALLLGSKKVPPVRSQRLVYDGTTVVGACAMGFADLGAGVSRCENVWRWLERDCTKLGVAPLCENADNRIGRQIMRFFDTNPGMTLPRILAWVQEIENRLPYAQVEMCVPGDSRPTASSIPEPGPQDLADVDKLIASAEEACV